MAKFELNTVEIIHNDLELWREAIVLGTPLSDWLIKWCLHGSMREVDT